MNPKEYTETLIAGYESQGLKVDRARLDRMVNIKKHLYLKFATMALKEGNLPKDMGPFLKYILDKFGDKWKYDV